MRSAYKEPFVSGLGLSEIGRRLPTTSLDLALDSVRSAIADAGLEVGDIDGVATLGDAPQSVVVRALGIEPELHLGRIGSSALFSPFLSAVEAIRDGRARHVLVYRNVNMLGGSYDPVAGPDPDWDPATDPGQNWRADLEHLNTDLNLLLAAHAFSAANWFALHCRRHMHLYGTTREQLGWLAVSSRRYAELNPHAVYRDPLTLDDYLNARIVSEPFGLLDCDVPVDGSVAVVLSHHAHAEDCPHPPVRVAAAGGADGIGGWTQRRDFPNMAMVDAATQMWDRTDLRPADVDVAQLYDGFTFLTLAWLEALGLCARGESGPFVDGGDRIALDGALPLNTYGGQLSAGRLHGHWALHEACTQLRGAAGARQVPGRPEVAVVSNGGGPMAGCALLTR